MALWPLSLSRNVIRLTSQKTVMASCRRYWQWQANQIEVPDIYKAIMAHFPKNIEMAFAYGSAVMQQENSSPAADNMIDFIFVVNNPVSWHKKNITLNPSHYSFIKWMGSRYVTRIQNKYSAQVYYNTLIRCEGRMIKYGVISTHHLITDLLDWNTLYVSGRLHKPVLLISPTNNNELHEAMDINRSSALHAALLQLPERFSEEMLFLKIAAISYNGDFRMKFGENRQKLTNIVLPNVDKFREIYMPFLSNEEHLQHIIWDKKRAIIEQYPNHVTQAHHLNLLPKHLQEKLLMLRTQQGAVSGAPDLEEILRILSHSSFCDDYIEQGLKSIVRDASFAQTFKSIFTAGFYRSVKYSLMKLKKMNLLSLLLTSKKSNSEHD